MSPLLSFHPLYHVVREILGIRDDRLDCQLISVHTNEEVNGSIPTRGAHVCDLRNYGLTSADLWVVPLENTISYA